MPGVNTQLQPLCSQVPPLCSTPGSHQVPRTTTAQTIPSEIPWPCPHPAALARWWVPLQDGAAQELSGVTASSPPSSQLKTSDQYLIPKKKTPAARDVSQMFEGLLMMNNKNSGFSFP